MKKLTTGACLGLLALPLLTSCASNAFAIEGGSKTVTVGNVDETIYSVDISWGSMEFDYLYSPALLDHYFMYKTECKAHEGYDGVADIAREMHSLFYDSSCQTSAEDAASGLHNDDTFYILEKSGSIIVEDKSVNGAIEAAVEFTPSANYSWVDGNFYSNYGISLYGGAGYREPLHRDGYLETIDRFHFGELELTKNYGAGNDKVINANDVIGTVTVTISPYSGGVGATE